MFRQVEEEVDIMDRHLQILEKVIEDEPNGIVKISNETGYQHHEVRYSLRILENENLIQPSNQGANTTEQTEAFVAKIDNKLDKVSATLDKMKISNT